MSKSLLQWRTALNYHSGKRHQFSSGYLVRTLGMLPSLTQGLLPSSEVRLTSGLLPTTEDSPTRVGSMGPQPSSWVKNKVPLQWPPLENALVFFQLYVRRSLFKCYKSSDDINEWSPNPSLILVNRMWNEWNYIMGTTY